MPARPPDILVFGVFFFAILFVLGGNIYTLVKSPPAIATGPNSEPIIVYPALDVQLGLEGMVASVVIMIGVIGLGLIYYSSRYVFQPNYAMRLMGLGVILAGAAFLIVTYLMMLKSPSRQGINPMLDIIRTLT
jgi:dipeptide/tripeptide permease